MVPLIVRKPQLVGILTGRRDLVSQCCLPLLLPADFPKWASLPISRKRTCNIGCRSMNPAFRAPWRMKGLNFRAYKATSSDF